MIEYMKILQEKSFKYRSQSNKRFDYMIYIEAI